ncbi:hypothetical protein Back11_63510 [Paenibacillus baekrokdamisoli]|uniref:Uncharacterized protein n=1 Tax=Paenibacillus baekrokdamisoli TaxID=1712516 RepID=A0A3G9J2M2_9BACL|nr:hypothetical protein [Paenibacillus baekrokdamisoli]MBB3069420.1 ligand-binding sensor domain-containing protein [Paenibacillus baekrokdamisoli]BBH25006.1 hypothetical protein Back11_63510 [Paenibacillus baekrokdamisoli]
MLPDSYKSWQSRPIHFSSVRVQSDRSVIAASPGKGIYHKSEHGDWNGLSKGLPESANINRLQLVNGVMYACTNKGLYRLDDQREWHFAEVGQSCYQYKEEWGYGFAATASGLLYKDSNKWKESAYENSIVYDFLFTPQYLYIGLDQGISMYDRMTDRWASFQLGFGVTSLAATRDHLFGASEQGELVVSNGEGGFSTIRFGDIFVFSVVSKHAQVYVCTDKGLYRVGRLGERLTLFSVKPGVPVTDMDWLGSELYIATLSKGIQTMHTEPWCQH